MKIKKLLAGVLAGAMVVGSLAVVSAEETTTLPEAVYTVDFSDATGITLNGSAAIVASPDDSTDSVLLVEDSDGQTTSTLGNGNYAVISGALTEFDFSEGITVSMDIRPNNQYTDWNYIYSISTQASTTTTHYNSWLGIDGTTGFIARAVGWGWSSLYPGDYFVTGNNVNSEYNYFGDYDDDGNYVAGSSTKCQWYRMTWVYSTTGVDIYVDGVHCVSWTDTNLYNEGSVSDSLEAVLADMSQCDIVLGAGISRGALENFQGYIDNVSIYASALTATEVAAIDGTATDDDEDADDDSDDDSDTEDDDDDSDDADDTDDTTATSSTTSSSTGDSFGFVLFLAGAAICMGAYVVVKKKLA